ncbi:hypothetical protein OG871_02690 [Kitasatospora sp. NBC_00374]|uniref:hypothetical protein n=1 Tax=Kitasatospora sp. NBC_00374 TaxID=2975964 RepID=UPI0030E18C8D
MRTAPLAVAVVVVAALATACSATGRESAPPGPVEIGAVPTLTTVKDRTLPIEAYLLNGRQTAQLQSAVGTLETRCMARFGFDYRPPQPDLQSPVTQTARRYGVTDPSEAASLGYHAPAGFSRAKEPATGLSAEGQQVLTGGGTPDRPAATPGPAVRGQAVPAGGCIGEAVAKVHPDRGLQEAELADRINSGDYERSLQDARVKDVFAKWSGCMKDKGYTYGTPLDALNDRRWATDSPSREETETALADQECAARHNVVGVWFTVESAMQRHDIDARAEALKKVKDSNEAALRRAAQVASGS